MLEQFRTASFILKMLTLLAIVGNAFAEMFLVFSVKLIELLLTSLVHTCPLCNLLPESLFITHEGRCAPIPAEVS
jgi:hypothetical protein